MERENVFFRNALLIYILLLVRLPLEHASLTQPECSEIFYGCGPPVKEE